MRANVAMADYILIRVFREEKQALKEVARKKGTSLSELVRASALAEAEQRIEA
ncbi:plasmid mobilization protein [Brucella sp. 22210]|uniref:plasmid mobilization protein n=1 Tax=Brucella sp. 22210 TaxID=3453892 RepID=UPI003F825791